MGDPGKPLHLCEANEHGYISSYVTGAMKIICLSTASRCHELQVKSDVTETPSDLEFLYQKPLQAYGQ